MANWIKQEDPTVYYLQKRHLIERNKHWLRVKGWKKIYQANGPSKQERKSSKTYSDKADFKLILIKRDKGYSHK
jgi:hypothetical protein